MPSKQRKDVSVNQPDEKKKRHAKSGKQSAGPANLREQELENQLKQALADYQNLKRDMQKRLDFEEEVIRADVLKSVIELADDIDLAVDHVDDEKGWREGVSMILEKFRKVIDDMGAEIMEVKPGDEFDPEIHEAVGVVYEGKDGTIASILQNGYKMGDIIVRPARVVVNKIKK